MNKRSLSILLRLTGVIIALILLCLGIKYTFSLLYPFFIAFGLAVILHPFVTFLENNGNLSRVFATLTAMLFIVVILIGTIFFIVTEFIQGTTYLADQVPAHFQSFMDMLNQFLNQEILPYYDKITSFFHTLKPSQQNVINDHIQKLTSQISSTGAALLQKMFLIIPTILSFLPQSMTVFIFIILATFFITKDLPLIRLKLRSIIPLATRKSTIHIFDHVRTLLFGYMKAQLMIISLTAIMIFIGLLIIKVEHSLTITILVALVDLLPFLGTGIIFIPWILYVFVTGNYVMTIQLSLLYIVVTIVRQIVEPKILSDHLGVRPLMTLVVVFAGFQLWGIIGIIIAPFLIVLYTAFKRAGVIEQLIHFVKG